MALDYTWGETVKVRMIDYIDEIIYAFDKEEQRGHTINTRASSYYIYKVDKYCEKLSPDKAKMFHNILAKTLYTTKWEIPDTCTEVDFLTTRVSNNIIIINIATIKGSAHVLNS